MVVLQEMKVGHVSFYDYAHSEVLFTMDRPDVVLTFSKLVAELADVTWYSVFAVIEVQVEDTPILVNSAVCECL